MSAAGRRRLGREAAALVAELADLDPMQAASVVLELRRTVERARRRPADDELEHHRRAAIEALERAPASAERCADELPRRGRFGYRYTCSKPASVAVAIRGTGRTYYRFLCAAHARRAEAEGAVAIIPLAREKLAAARRRAEREREERWRQEDAAEQIGRAIHAAARVRVHELSDIERARRRRRKDAIG